MTRRKTQPGAAARRRWLGRTALLALSLALTGCGTGMGDLEERIADIKAEPGPKPEEYPKPTPYTPYAYVPGDRRDPFSPVAPAAESVAGDGPRPDVTRNKEPLEEFPIDSLKMVGTLNMNKRSFALVKSPDNVVHRVSVGDHLGQDFGEIIGISETEIKVKETISSGLNTWVNRDTSLALVQ